MGGDRVSLPFWDRKNEDPPPPPRVVRGGASGIELLKLQRTSSCSLMDCDKTEPDGVDDEE